MRFVADEKVWNSELLISKTLSKFSNLATLKQYNLGHLVIFGWFIFSLYGGVVKMVLCWFYETLYALDCLHYLCTNLNCKRGGLELH